MLSPHPQVSCHRWLSRFFIYFFNLGFGLQTTTLVQVSPPAHVRQAQPGSSPPTSPRPPARREPLTHPLAALESGGALGKEVCCFLLCPNTNKPHPKPHLGNLSFGLGPEGILQRNGTPPHPPLSKPPYPILPLPPHTLTRRKQLEKGLADGENGVGRRNAADSCVQISTAWRRVACLVAAGHRQWPELAVAGRDTAAAMAFPLAPGAKSPL